MRKLSIPLLRLTHVAAIFCFCLPFLPINCNCGPSAEEKAAMEMARRDSISAVELAQASEIQKPEKLNQETLYNSDTSINEANIQDSLSVNNDILSSNSESESVFKKIYVAILLPDGNLSGLFLVMIEIDNLINFREGFLFPFLSISIFLIVYSFIQSFFKSKKVFKRIFTSSIFQIICLLVFLFIGIDMSEILYGYWVTLGMCFVNAYISYKLSKKESE